MPHPLEQRSSSCDAVRATAAVYGLSLATAALLATMAALGLTDYLLRFQDRGLRIIASLLVLGVLGWTFYRYVFPVWLERLQDVDRGRIVQRRFPRLGDRLLTAVEFLHVAHDDPTAGSTALRQAVVAATTAETERLDFSAVLDRRPTARAAMVLGGVPSGRRCVVLDPLASQIAVARGGDRLFGCPGRK